MIPDPTPFSYSNLRKLLVTARDAGRVLRLRDVDGGPGLILRHDVDLALSPALAMARLEVEVGVRSSFFFLVTSPHYNVLAKLSRDVLGELAELGFEVGLHFDPTVYGAIEFEALRRRLDEEREILATASGTDVVSVSLHNPSVSGEFPLFPGLHNAYDPAVFERDRYLSDSRMTFAHGDPWAFVKRGVDDLVQLLLHPMHFAESACDYPELFRRHVHQLVELLDTSFSVNSTYTSTLPDGLMRELRGDRPTDSV